MFNARVAGREIYKIRGMDVALALSGEFHVLFKHGNNFRGERGHRPAVGRPRKHLKNFTPQSRRV